MSLPNLGPSLFEVGFQLFLDHAFGIVQENQFLHVHLRQDQVLHFLHQLAHVRRKVRGMLSLRSGWRTRIFLFCAATAPWTRFFLGVVHLLFQIRVDGSRVYLGETAEVHRFAFSANEAVRSRYRRSAKNGAYGLINWLTVYKQVYSVSYAACFSLFISPFQNTRRERRTYQLDRSSQTKSSMARAAGGGS